MAFVPVGRSDTPVHERASVGGVTSDVDLHEPDGSAPPAGAAAESLRERKKQATRKAIEDAAWELFAERGYAATSIDDIAARAEIAPRTFFRYFPTKDDVLYCEFEDAMVRFAEEFRARPTDEPVVASLVAALDAVSQEMVKDRDRMLQRHALQESAGLEMSESIKQRFGAAIADLVRERVGDDRDGELLARLLASTIVACQTIASEIWLEEGASADLHEIGKRCLQVLIDALGDVAERDG